MWNIIMYMDANINNSTILSPSSSRDESKKWRRKSSPRLSTILSDLSSNVKQNRPRAKFLHAIYNNSCSFYRNHDNTNNNNNEKIKMVDNSPNSEAFEGVLKDSVHRRIPRLTADIVDNIKIKDTSKKPTVANLHFDRALTPSSPTSFCAVLPRPFSPVEKNSAKIFIEKIRRTKKIVGRWEEYCIFGFINVRVIISEFNSSSFYIVSRNVWLRLTLRRGRSNY